MSDNSSQEQAKVPAPVPAPVPSSPCLTCESEAVKIRDSKQEQEKERTLKEKGRKHRCFLEFCQQINSACDTLLIYEDTKSEMAKSTQLLLSADRQTQLILLLKTAVCSMLISEFGNIEDAPKETSKEYAKTTKNIDSVVDSFVNNNKDLIKFIESVPR